MKVTLVTALLELVKEETDSTLPKFHVEIRFDPSTGIGPVHRWLCHFRRYDWDWTNEAEGLHGYGSGGLNVCNGGGFMFPCRSAEEFVAVTMGITVDRMFINLKQAVKRLCAPQGVDYSRWTEAEKELSYQGRRAVESALEASRPALQWILEDALAHPSSHFSRVFAGYRGGASASTAAVELKGFEQEERENMWVKKGVA